MIIPGWLTIHVIGYGLAGVLLTGTGAVLIHEHDNRVKAEMHAQDLAIAHQHEDSIMATQNLAAVAAQAALVDAATKQVQPQLVREKHYIDTATKYIHDTLLVRQALDSAKSTIAGCTEYVLTCDQFKRMATDSLKSLANRLALRDHDVLVAVTPPAPRITHGLQLGVGGCLVGRKIDGKVSVFGTPCASLTYGFSLRIP